MAPIHDLVNTHRETNRGAWVRAMHSLLHVYVVLFVYTFFFSHAPRPILCPTCPVVFLPPLDPCAWLCALLPRTIYDRCCSLLGSHSFRIHAFIPYSFFFLTASSLICDPQKYLPSRNWKYPSPKPFSPRDRPYLQKRGYLSVPTAHNAGDRRCMAWEVFGTFFLSCLF